MKVKVVRSVTHDLHLHCGGYAAFIGHDKYSGHIHLFRELVNEQRTNGLARECRTPPASYTEWSAEYRRG